MRRIYHDIHIIKVQYEFTIFHLSPGLFIILKSAGAVQSDARYEYKIIYYILLCIRIYIRGSRVTYIDMGLNLSYTCSEN